MIYADTNVLLALYCRDSTSDAADRWAASVEARIVTSWWTVVEFKAHIGLRARKKHLSQAAALAVLAVFERDFVISQKPLNTLSPHWEMAVAWLSNPALALRSGDALHLATSHGYDCENFVTFDADLARAAKKLELPIKLLRA